MTAETNTPSEERPSQSMKEHGRNGQFFSLKPRLLQCAGLSQAILARDIDSARSITQRTIAAGAEPAQTMGEPISRGNWEH